MIKPGPLCMWRTWERNCSDAIDGGVSCLSTEGFHLLVAWRSCWQVVSLGPYGSKAENKRKHSFIKDGYSQRLEKAVQVSIPTTHLFKLVNLEDVFVKFKIGHMLAEFLLRFSHCYWESDLILSVDCLAFLLEHTFHCFLFIEMSWCQSKNSLQSKCINISDML